MSALDALPGHLAPALTELFKGVIGHPDVYTNNAKLSAKISEIRLCVDTVISTLLAKRNDTLGRPLGLMVLPNDALLLVSEHLSLPDVWSASQVCSRLRAVTLSCSRLWTQLEVHASERPGTDVDEVQEFLEEDYPPQAIMFSNLALVRGVLHRSAKNLLSLKVTVTAGCIIPHEFIGKLDSFLALVSPRLWALHIQTDCQNLLKSLFCARRRVLPDLRELAVSAPDVLCIPIAVDLAAMSFPGLTHLELHNGFEIKAAPPTPSLKVLRCDAAQILDILPILTHADGLERVAFSPSRTFPCPFSEAESNHDLLSALDAIPSVRFRAEIRGEGERCAAVCHFVDHLPHPSLGLDLVAEGYPPIICLRCDRVLSATQIVMLDSPKSIDIIITDTSRRTTTVRVFDEPTYYNNPRGEHTQPLDWSLIPALDSLTSLRVDASIWRLVMADFPRAPLLTEITLNINDFSSLDSLRSPMSVARDFDAIGHDMGESLGVPQAIRELGAHVHFEEDQPERPVPPVPSGVSLTVSSHAPLSIDGWCVGDLMELLGVEQVKLDRVVLEDDREFADRALSALQRC